MFCILCRIEGEDILQRICLASICRPAQQISQLKGNCSMRIHEYSNLGVVENYCWSTTSDGTVQTIKEVELILQASVDEFRSSEQKLDDTLHQAIIS